jgi:hypothetical protein|tara:strand:+ start:84 stop:653 length:570 start_codon:yes stop_codon:yes gene_type:complete
MHISKLRLLPILVIFLVFNCKRQQEDSFNFSELQPQEALTNIEIKDNLFYSNNSIFKGSISATKEEFALNIRDQFNGQTIIAFKQLNWYRHLPFRFQIENNYNGKVMIGRITDSAAAKGLGYVMTEGYIELKYLDDKKMILSIKGKGSQYGENGLTDELVAFKGEVLFKEPIVVMEGIKLEEIVNNNSY